MSFKAGPSLTDRSGHGNEVKAEPWLGGQRISVLPWPLLSRQLQHTRSLHSEPLHPLCVLGFLWFGAFIFEQT